eukprot:m.158641 g.158641  ORF g.158641 m.158641 type:complete len:101 (-) comp31103_c0_seq3:248-550(-)
MSMLSMQPTLSTNVFKVCTLFSILSLLVNGQTTIPDHHSGKPSAGADVGIGIAGLVVGSILIVVVFYVCQWRKQSNTSYSEVRFNDEFVVPKKIEYDRDM